MKTKQENENRMSNRKRVLILCTGNSARSQMAEGLLRHDGGEMFTVESAGVEASFVKPQAIAAMREIGVDIGDHRSKSVDEFKGQEFDYVITVCDNAKERCPIFPGSPQQIHWSIDDPVVLASEEGQVANFRRARDELRSRLRDFIQSERDRR
jgi:arsenate reductase (thioredoxin)